MTRLGNPFHAILCTMAVAAGATDCLAQSATGSARTPPASAVVIADRKVPTALEAQPAPPLPDLGSASGKRPPLRGGTTDLLGSYVQLEMPRDLGDGQYSRPKLRFGMQSESLKSWVKETGLQPERCTLPTLRARSSASTGDINGSVMLLARCTFY